MSITTTPLVSVVVPVFNNASHLEQALQSIANQTHPKIELVIVDRGSTDDSLAVIKRFQETRKNFHQISVIAQEKQSDYDCINLGLSFAKGEWLTVLHPEDFYHPHRLETMLSQLLSTQATVAFSYVAGIDAEGAPLPLNHAWWQWYERARCTLFLHGLTVGFHLFQENLIVAIGNLMFSRSLFQEVGPFKNLQVESIRDFLLRALLLTEPLLVRETLYFHRVCEQTLFRQEVQESELKDIHCEYLCHSFARPPKNHTAPCHWYWPTEFQKLCSKLRLDRGLDKFILLPPSQKNEIFPVTSKNIGSVKNPKKALQVTLISHELSLSGAPKLIADLALSLKNHGYQPQVVAIYDGPMRHELEKQHIPVYSLRNHSSSHHRTSLSLIPLILYHTCFRIRGIVIGNSIASFPLLFPISILRPWCRSFWYIHESFTPFGIVKNKLSGKIVSFITRLCQKINPPRMWFGSKATQQAWTYSEMEKGKVMYWSGIPSHQVRQSPKSRLTKVLSVGTASKRKGTQTLINAFLLCLREGWIPEDTVLTIVGFSAQCLEFKSLTDSILKIVTSKYRDNFKLVGNVQPDQLDAFYDDTDLFIQSSVLECMPIALLTAMSKGLPIVTTDVDGCKEAITHGHTGYLCQPYDERSLAETIATALNSPEKSLKMGCCAAEEFNQRFSLEATQKRFFEELSV